MLTVTLDPRAETLFEPVRPMLTEALRLLPGAPPLGVTVGRFDAADVAGSPFFRLSGDAVVLSEGLLGPDLQHADEPDRGVRPLDRWRRALGSVLEAASLRELARRTHLTPDNDWRWVGAAIYAADAVSPDLGLALPDLALALSSGSPGAHPRAGVAVMQAWAAEGVDPIKQTRYLLEGGVVSPREWLRIGQWVLGIDGLITQLPVRLGRLADADIPVTLAPWSWQPLHVPAHARGGFVRVEGDGAVDDPWAVADAPLRALGVAASGPCTLRPDPGGPVGTFEVASAEGFGQVMGARGIQFCFHADGRIEIVLADAFVGPLAAVGMAGEVGTSGVCAGRWKVQGPHRFSFHGIETASLTLHSRTRDRFMMPARGFGLGEWLQALGEDVWSWHRSPERLVLRGRMLGGEVEVRLRRPAGAPSPMV